LAISFKCHFFIKTYICGNTLNNNASNLIWPTAKEHDEAHSLLKIATETNDDSEYQAFITEKAKENQWDKEYRCLLKGLIEDVYYL